MCRCQIKDCPKGYMLSTGARKIGLRQASLHLEVCEASWIEKMFALKYECSPNLVRPMSMSFLEYSAAVGCYSAMPRRDREALHAWEVKHVTGSGLYGTSDWPGWQKYIGKLQTPGPKEVNLFGYVYLVQSETGDCKIGSSRSVARRIQQLQSANPGPLVLLHEFPSANAQRDEYALHKKFAHRCVRNEWFALTGADIAVIRSIKLPQTSNQAMQPPDALTAGHA